MRQKIFLLFALLCAVAQGARAQNYDVWDGVTQKQPSITEVGAYETRIDINSAAEMAWLMAHFANGVHYWSNWLDRQLTQIPNQSNISLNVDVDMTAGNWTPKIYRHNVSAGGTQTFEGNGHTIKIKIDGVSDNYQGLFSEVSEYTKVQNLHLVADIHCSNSRLVGGICGQNNGTIENCWVSGLVQSDWREPSSAYTAKVGGICGQNNGTVQYCCVTADVKNDDADVGGLVGDNNHSGATVKHCTFYGTRNSTHDQDSKYVGDSGTEENLYDTFSLDEYNAASGKDMYRHAIRYTYDVTVNIEGRGTVRTRALDEDDVPGTCAGQTFSLNVTSGTALNVTVTDADGKNVPLQGHANDNSSFWFVMPSKKVTATVTFSYTDWPTQGAGTVDDPYIISSADDWYDFAHNVTIGRNYSGYHVKLTANISVSKMAGNYQADDNYQPFSGIFDGNNKTLTLNVSNQGRFAAPFKCVSGATIKNLRTAGTISGGGNADGKLLAGIVGMSFGNTTITNCVSCVTLTTDFGEDAALAGIVAGTKGGSLTISGCVFDGSMTGATNTRCAGISGYEYGGTTTTITNSLFAPATLTVSTTDDTYTKTFSRDADATITDCYYTRVLGTAQGTAAMRTVQTPVAIGTLVHDYGFMKIYQNGLLYGGKYYYAPAISAGSFTQADPYLIGSTDNWNDFAQNVGIGHTFNGQFVKLTSDISVSTMANGTFSGTFDGDGKTINANISGSGAMALFGSLNGGTIKNLKLTGSVSGDIHTAALLVSLGNSGTNIIENCVVTANVNCSSTHMGGFLAHGNSSNITMRGCVFKGKMTGGSSAKGVFYGWGSSSGSITNCLYIMASGQDTDGLDLAKGDGTITVTNSYRTANACSHGTMANVTDQTPTNIGSLVQGYGFMNAYQHGILFDGLYYVDPNYAPAFQLLKAATASDIGKVVCAAGHLHPAKAAVPDGCTAVGILGKVTGYGQGLILALHDASNQTWETINGWTSVNAYAGTTLKLLPDGTRGSLTSITSLGDVAVSNWCVAQKDDYTDIFQNLGSAKNDGGYTYDANVNAYLTTGVGGTAMVDFYMDSFYWSATDGRGFQNLYWDYNMDKTTDGSVRPVLGFTFIASELPGTGTAGDPYTISNSDEWINFVYNVNNGDLFNFVNNVNNGNSYNGKYVKLTADISVTTPVGYHESDSDNKPFSGTFLGDGHTITVTLTDDSNSGLAPFRYISGATIKNLKVAGTIASSQYHTAGIAGFASGTNTIEGCVVTATLNISSDYAGGIIGHGLTSATTIRGCAFTGTVNGVDGNRSNIGGLWGWSSDATPALVNCLEAGTYTNIASMHPMGLQGTTGTITNCYYLNPQVGEPRNACTVSGAKQAYTTATAPANLGSLVEDYGMVKAYANGILVGGTYYAVPATVTLADNSDNGTTISDANGYFVDVTLTDRTLYKDGAWNTICLPFDVTIAGSPLAGATARPLTSASISGSTLNLTFGDAVDELVAGTPYIIKWPTNSNSPVTCTYTATSGTGTGDGGYDKLVDGNTDTKWCTNGPWTCEFNTSDPVDVTGYTLTTGGDTETYKDRNPLKWTLEAKAKESDEWTVIDSRDVTTNSGDALPETNTAESQVYAIAGDKQGVYQYFRFTVTQAGGTLMQLSELTLQQGHLVSPVFSGVTIDATDRSYDNSASGDNRVRFLGTYKSTAFDAEDKSILLMGGGNALYYPTAGAGIGAQRAYFKIGSDGALLARRLTAFNIDFGDDEATGIISVHDSGFMVNGSDAWFTLDGRRLSAKPSRAGVYINNGKKVVIK